jgi:hypothetical protein
VSFDLCATPFFLEVIPLVAPEDVARYREQIAERKARAEAGERDGWGPGGYKWRR